ncbi:DUF7144 family membrane protein [Pseudonocardia broussonetiae]|uniref:DUF7144 domain-containing protein n=1 Tax=Pseudonocardia broussonetiae TaxID=2736640 RepID=A0A6M6JQD2_9PSEU|nr:hypothetical protein [Pseudonocardia broussonetiae]QJY49207.1 hypothetical protein HOP40_28475 [Pseudonocardia broussonetiae]
MSTVNPSPHGAGRRMHERPWVNGFSLFAVAALLVLGLWQVLAGAAVVARGADPTALPAYFGSTDPASWGWALILVGIATAGAGVAVLTERAWGTTAATVLVVLSTILNFALLPLHPVYAVVIIALDVAAARALTAYDRDIA